MDDRWCADRGPGRLSVLAAGGMQQWHLFDHFEVASLNSLRGTDGRAVVQHVQKRNETK